MGLKTVAINYTFNGGNRKVCEYASYFAKCCGLEYWGIFVLNQSITVTLLASLELYMAYVCVIIVQTPLKTKTYFSIFGEDEFF